LIVAIFASSSRRCAKVRAPVSSPSLDSRGQWPQPDLLGPQEGQRADGNGSPGSITAGCMEGVWLGK
jgi:hypothetical protein